ncbi:tetratricopeptide repeat protein [Micromonospora sp. WMMD729]|uniref:tetratricopeptide repeat protein n=1 Tax=Micromonospora sp. WMMD729 TaxID=3404127 RepID=UPI003BF5A33E
MSFSEDVRSAFRRGETEAVVRMSTAEIERARAAGDAANEVEARYSLARVAIRGGDLALGETRAREALDVAVRSGDRALEERPRHVLAAVARMAGDLDRARDLYRESIALNESLGRPETVNSETHNLAFCELGLGNLAEARRLFTLSRTRVFQHRWDDFVPYVCVAGAALASAEGDHPRAALMVGLADAAFAAIGQVPDPDDAADLAAVREAAIEVLGPAAHAAAQERGRHLDPRAAFADDDR